MNQGFIYMVMEIMNGGELFDRIMEKSMYSEQDAIEVTRSLCKALAKCHLHQVVHLDLKPENVLYQEKEGQEGGDIVKICDFGISRTLDPEHPAGGKLEKGKCAPDGRLHGTPGYIAPEMILQQPFDEKCDVWQLGVLTYILLSGIPPFEEPPELEGTQEGMDAMFEYIKDGDFFPFDQYVPVEGEANPWEICSPDARDFIEKALTPDPDQRPSTKDLLLHPWIVNDHMREAHSRRRMLPITQKRIGILSAKKKLQKNVRRLILIGRLSKIAGAGGFGALTEQAKAAANGRPAEKTGSEAETSGLEEEDEDED